MKADARLLPLMVLAVGLAGCAGLRDLKAPAGDPPLALYRDQAEAAEEGGDLAAAERGFRLALTADPGDGEAAAGLQRVEKARRAQAERRYQEGLALQRAGKLQDARRAFLAALHGWPAHPEARAALGGGRGPAPGEAYIVHRVQPGETLVIIAKRYYGDHRQFEAIARFNGLSDATRVHVGQELRLPGLAAAPPTGSATASAPPATAPTTTASTAPPALPPAAAAPAAEPPPPDPPEEEPDAASQAQAMQLASYRDSGADLLRAGRHEEALVEFRKVLNTAPQDGPTLNLMAQALVGSARELLAANRHAEARRQLEACLALRDACRQCDGALAEAEGLYKEMLYTRGIQLFGAEKPEEALREWEPLMALDPGYKRVSEYVAQARQITERLQTLKKTRSN
jgi:tetratricopeptide (TPR) repeat protein